MRPTHDGAVIFFPRRRVRRGLMTHRTSSQVKDEIVSVKAMCQTLVEEMGPSMSTIADAVQLHGQSITKAINHQKNVLLKRCETAESELMSNLSNQEHQDHVRASKLKTVLLQAQTVRKQWALVKRELPCIIRRLREDSLSMLTVVGEKGQTWLADINHRLQEEKGRHERCVLELERVRMNYKKECNSLLVVRQQSEAQQIKTEQAMAQSEALSNRLGLLRRHIESEKERFESQERSSSQEVIELREQLAMQQAHLSQFKQAAKQSEKELHDLLAVCSARQQQEAEGRTKDLEKYRRDAEAKLAEARESWQVEMDNRVAAEIKRGVERCGQVQADRDQVQHARDEHGFLDSLTCDHVLSQQ